MARSRPILVCVLWTLCGLVPLGGEIRLLDESDRAAFRAWFGFLADAQFYRPSPHVADCAALVREAVREALRAHTPEWTRRAALPIAPSFPDVRRPPASAGGMWPLFRVDPSPGPRVEPRYAEFADARTLVYLNMTPVARDGRAARPGDLLYFRQADQADPHHLMVFVGDSLFDAGARDWVVYHTGPIAGRPGEVRKVRLADLERHPAPRWRPKATNRSFVGVFRWAFQ